MRELKYEVIGANNNIGLITILHPEMLNAANSCVISEFRELLDEIGRDEYIRCVILTGAGRVSPADVENDEDTQNDKLSDDSFIYNCNCAEVLDALEHFRMPVIAAINGCALGIGLGFVLACDIRIASSPAFFGAPKIALTSTLDWESIRRLLHLVSPSRAKQMLFTGEKISAEEAYRIGLVDRLTTSGTLMDTALNMAERISERDPAVMTYLKVAISNDLNAILNKV